MRSASSFTADEREVIRERRHGWEQASCADLARIFDTTPQTIAAITKLSPAAICLPAAPKRSAPDPTRIPVTGAGRAFVS